MTKATHMNLSLLTCYYVRRGKMVLFCCRKFLKMGARLETVRARQVARRNLKRIPVRRPEVEVRNVLRTGRTSPQSGALIIRIDEFSESQSSFERQESGECRVKHPCRAIPPCSRAGVNIARRAPSQNSS